MKFLIISALPIIAFGWTIEEYPDCNVEYVYRRTLIGNGFCNQQYNTEACGWDGGDCLEANETNPPPGWPVPGGRDAGGGDDEDEDEYPDCPVNYANRRRWIGNGHCNPILNTAECGWDGGDCVELNEANPHLNLVPPETETRTSIPTARSSTLIASIGSAMDTATTSSILPNAVMTVAIASRTTSPNLVLPTEATPPCLWMAPGLLSSPPPLP